MNLGSISLWGFAATVLLTTLIVVAQSAGLTRLDMPLILGSIFTADRDRAKVYGYAFHVLNGWALALVYALFFDNVQGATWWFGGIMGLIQGTIVAAVVLPLLPGVHPRMVSDARGPEPTRLLEPPGFFSTNYGRITPLVTITAHTLYGVLLGLFYVPR